MLVEKSLRRLPHIGSPVPTVVVTLARSWSAIAEIFNRVSLDVAANVAHRVTCCDELVGVGTKLGTFSGLGRVDERTRDALSSIQLARV